MYILFWKPVVIQRIHFTRVFYPKEHLSSFFRIFQ